jgi:hypothetical protein
VVEQDSQAAPVRAPLRPKQPTSGGFSRHKRPGRTNPRRARAELSSAIVEFLSHDE